MKKNIRESNYELMRIISMFMIVVWHVFLHGANMESSSGTVKMLYDIFRAIIVVHVNSFVLVSGYFQCKSKFKMSKVISLNNTVVFYKILIMLIFLIFGIVNVSKVSILRNIFPLDLENYWFIRIYLMLYILSPFLNIFINKIDKNQYKKLLFILFIMFSIISTITKQEALNGIVNYGYSLVSFMFLYLLGGYLRNYPIKNTYIGKRFTKNAQLLIFIFLFFFFAMINFSLHIVSIKLNEGGELSKYIGNILFVSFNQYDNPLVILGSICYFLSFGYINLKSKIINIISSTTLGIYIIHENLFIRYNVYKLFKFTDVATSNSVFLKIFVVSSIIFVVCSLIEILRKLLFGCIYKTKFSSKFRKKCISFIESLGFRINW